MSTAQLALEFEHRPAFGTEDFLVAPCNVGAVAWIDRWPDWLGTALTIHGPAGCGKSHLAQVWRARASAIEFPKANLVVAGLADRLGNATAVIVEDAEHDIEEEALLHLFNMLAERRGHLLMTARAAPARWNIGIADLRSRLVAAPAIAVELPDETLIGALLVKLFADRQIRVSTELISYLVARMERSFAAAQSLVAELDAAALAAGRPITVPLARGVVDQWAARKDRQAKQD